jgi:O-antigen/teichoic acid export membrane protein
MKRKQLILNISANMLSVVISLCIGFILTPYIVSSIGKEAYSFIPISNNFVSYMGILTIALTSMTARFVTINVHKDDIGSANNYYSTSFYTNLATTLGMSVICFIVVIYLDKIINIPLKILNDVRALFSIMFITFLLNVSTTTFSVASFSMNRLDISSIISIIASFMRILVIILMFSFFKPRIWYIGLSVFAAISITALLNYLISKKIMPAIRISYKRVRLKIVKELFSSGVWNTFNQLSNVLMTGLDLVIANIVLGASAAGTLAIAKTVPIALQSVISVLPNAFHPYLTILYAKENRKLFINELLYTLKFNSILTGIPIAGFIVLSAVFFKLWVPSQANTQLTVLSILTMISMVGTFGIMPLTFIFTITNRLKWSSVIIFMTGFTNIVIVLALLKTTNLGLYAIAGISSVLEVLRCLVFVPIYAAHCLGERKSIFYPSIIRSLSYMALLIAFFSLIAFIIPVHSWLALLAATSLMGILGLIIGVLFMLNKKEKLFSMLMGFLHKLKLA